MPFNALAMDRGRSMREVDRYVPRKHRAGAEARHHFSSSFSTGDVSFEYDWIGVSLDRPADR